MSRQKNKYKNINDDEDAVTVRGERKQRRRVCCWGSLFALLTATLLGLLVAIITVGVLGFLSTTTDEEVGTCEQPPSVAVNCIPEGGRSETEDTCLERGCCWAGSDVTPSCFYPDGFGYAVDGAPAVTPTGMTVNATRKTGQPSQYGRDIETVRVDFYYETPYRLRVKVSRLSSLYQKVRSARGPPHARVSIWRAAISPSPFLTGCISTALFPLRSCGTPPPDDMRFPSPPPSLVARPQTLSTKSHFPPKPLASPSKGPPCLETCELLDFFPVANHACCECIYMFKGLV